MSPSVYNARSSFRIRAVHREALTAAMLAFLHEQLEGFDDQALTLIEAFRKVGIEALEQASGDLVDLVLLHHEASDLAFGALEKVVAPFAEEGSRLDFIWDDGLQFAFLYGRDAAGIPVARRETVYPLVASELVALITAAAPTAPETARVLRSRYLCPPRHGTIH
jgi:hypothetical protein